MHEFELLAPAGSFEILKAVISAGADAVYVGGNMFGARAYANNFSEEELKEAIDYVHLRKKRLYLTVNTLLKNEEIKNKLYDFLLPLYEQGLDGVIVQDLGAVKYIHEAFPDMEIHTSTQMTITGVEGAELLKQFGVTRVVMAREVSLDEMHLIHEKTGLELEAFVHGAMCYCYSGQCLFSSMLGGRSGNRGRCAQPCRLPYTVLDEKKNIKKKDSYILSMKDLCGIEDIPRLAEAGIFSLKIEGRMKQADYAAGVVSMYRKYIDAYQQQENWKVFPKDYQKLSDYGNRCGFSNEYYYRHNSSDMITYVKPSYEKKETDILDTLTEIRIPIDGRAVLHKKEPACLQVSYGNLLVMAEGPEVSIANNRPVTREEILNRLDKTGETPFFFQNLEVDKDEDIFIPNGALNRLKRDALHLLEERLLEKFRRKAYRKPDEIHQTFREKTKSIFLAEVETSEQLHVVTEYDFITDVYLHAYKYPKEDLISALSKDVDFVTSKGKNAYFAFPQIFRKAEALYYSSLVEELASIPLNGVVVSNYEELAFAAEHLSHLEIVTDHNLYTYNDYAVKAFEELGADIHTIPLELNRQEISYLNHALSEMVVYGYYPLMVSAQCVHRNCFGCDKKQETLYLKDRYKAEFPVKNHCGECFNVIYNSLPTKLFSRVRELQDFGIGRFRLCFTVEDAISTAEILEMLQDELANGSVSEKDNKNRFTKGHYGRGVE